MSKVNYCPAGEEMHKCYCRPTYETLELKIRDLENRISSYVTGMVNLSDSCIEKHNEIERFKEIIQNLHRMLDICENGIKRRDLLTIE